MVDLVFGLLLLGRSTSSIGPAFLRKFSLWSAEVDEGFNVGVRDCFADTRDDRKAYRAFF